MATPQELLELVAGAVGPLEAADPAAPWIVPADRLTAICTALRDEPRLAMESLMDLTAVDRKADGVIEVVYHLCSMTHHHSVTLKVKVDRGTEVSERVSVPPQSGGSEETEGGAGTGDEAPGPATPLPATVPSVAAVWPAADWFEREVYDLFGVRFDGHPDLRRILCPDDWVGHPLRKDYVRAAPDIPIVKKKDLV